MNRKWWTNPLTIGLLLCFLLYPGWTLYFYIFEYLPEGAYSHLQSKGKKVLYLCSLRNNNWDTSPRNGLHEVIFWLDPDCDSYEGDILNGKPHGYGIKYNPSGIITSKGMYKNGFLDGQGMYRNNLGRYVGEFKKGLLHGRGIQYFSNGYRWEGEFRQELKWNVRMFDNYGNIIGKWVNGVQYDKNGKRLGRYVKNKSFFEVKGFHGALHYTYESD